MGDNFGNCSISLSYWTTNYHTLLTRIFDFESIILFIVSLTECHYNFCSTCTITFWNSSKFNTFDIISFNIKIVS